MNITTTDSTLTWHYIENQESIEGFTSVAVQSILWASTNIY